MEAIPDVESVSAYLQELFNTPQGGSGACPDFGMPPVEIIRWSKEEFKQAFSIFKNCIDRYEPRLYALKSGDYDPNGKLVGMKAKLVIRKTESKVGVPVSVQIAVGEIGKIKVLVECL